MFAEPFSTASIGRKNQVKARCNGTAHIAVLSGSAMARFFGISSPRIVLWRVSWETEKKRRSLSRRSRLRQAPLTATLSPT